MWPFSLKESWCMFFMPYLLSMIFLLLMFLKYSCKIYTTHWWHWGENIITINFFYLFFLIQRDKAIVIENVKFWRYLLIYLSEWFLCKYVQWWRLVSSRHETDSRILILLYRVNYLLWLLINIFSLIMANWSSITFLMWYTFT